MAIGRTLKDWIKPIEPKSEAELCLFRAARNREDRLAGRNRSILFFTTHKCASTFTSRFLAELDANSDLRHVNYTRIISKAGNDVDVGNMEQFMADCQDMLFDDVGDVYGPLRNPFDLRGIETYRKIFFLRDPRDVLVSAYYSFGFSHSVPRNDQRAELFNRNRAKVKDEGIDQFCLRSAEEWIVPLLQKYQTIREGSGGLFVSYRDFVDNPKTFMTQLLDYIDLPDGAKRERLLAFVMHEIDQGPKPQANPDEPAKLTHRRSGRHGQYLHELEAETIASLNTILAEQLAYWGFDAHDKPA